MQINLLIGGGGIGAGATYERCNAIDGTVAPVAAATAQDAVAAADAAGRAFPSWSAMGPNARRAVLLPAAELIPFGGIGASGYGRFGGRASFAEFTDLRWTAINAETPHYPF